MRRPLVAALSLVMLLAALTGCADDDEVPLNEPPIADIQGPSSGDVGEVLAFDGSNSTDDGGLLQYSWEWGDGFRGNGTTATHTYMEPGTYTVSLTVRDADGASDAAIMVVTIKWNVALLLSHPTIMQYTRTDTCWDAVLNVNKVVPGEARVPWTDLRLTVRDASGSVIQDPTAMVPDSPKYADPASPEYWYIDIAGDAWISAGDAIKITGMDVTWEAAHVTLQLDGETVSSVNLPTDFP